MHCMALPCCDKKLPKPNTFIQQIGIIITSARRLGQFHLCLFVCLTLGYLKKYWADVHVSLCKSWP